MVETGCSSISRVPSVVITSFPSFFIVKIDDGKTITIAIPHTKTNRLYFALWKTDNVAATKANIGKTTANRLRRKQNFRYLPNRIILNV